MMRTINRCKDPFTHDFSSFKHESKRYRRSTTLDKSLVKISKSLMKENYLNDIEILLSEDYLVCVQPKGHKCVLVTQSNETLVILNTGKLLFKFKSKLPNHDLNQPNTILECYYVNNSFLIIQDVLLWDTVDFREKSAFYRLSILKNLLNSLEQSSLLIQMIEIFACDINSIDFCYKCDKPYLKEGILFYRASGSYEEGLTRNKFKWRDAYCSVSEPESSILTLTSSNYLVTLDEIVVHKLDRNTVASHKLYSGQTIVVDTIDIENFSITELEILKPSSNLPTSFSELLFNWRLKTNRVNFLDFYDLFSTDDHTEDPQQNYFEDIFNFDF